MKRKEAERVMDKAGRAHRSKRIRTKIIAGAVTLTLIGGTAGSYCVIRTHAADDGVSQTTAAEADKSDKDTENTLGSIIKKEMNQDDTAVADKEETVYVNADAQGAVQHITVSDALHNEEASSKLADASDLSDIQNLKGDETYTAGNDGSLVWDAGGSDIYYQGTTDKALPVEMKITYTLDGKTVSPDEIAGKSGKVTIRFNYTNKETRQTVINGKTETIYVPFVVVSAFMLSNDNFSNISVTNGKAVNDGDNTVIIGCALPGLSDSLSINDSELSSKADEISIPDYVEVTADADDFKMGVTMTGIASDVMADMDLTGSLDTASLKTSVNKLGDSSDQLENGSTELMNGITSLDSGFLAFSNGIGTLDKNLSTAQAGAVKLAQGAAAASNGEDTLYNGLSALNSGLLGAEAGSRELVAGYSGARGAVAGAAGVSTGAASISNAVSLLDDGINEEGGLASGTAALSSGAAKLAESTTKLSSGADSLQTGLETSYNNISSQINVYNTSASQLSTYQEELAELLNNASQSSMTQEEAAAFAAKVNTLTAAIAQCSGAQGASAALSGVQGSLSGLVGSDGELAELTAGAQEVKAGAASVSQYAASVNEGVNGSAGLSAQVTQLNAGASQLSSGAINLNTGINTLYSGTSSLADGISTGAAGSQKLLAGAQELSSGGLLLADGANAVSSGITALSAGSTSLVTASGELESGISKLCDGSSQLNDGMVMFNDEGIRRIVDVFNGDVSDLVDRINAVCDAAGTYHTFTKLSDGTDGSVKFVIETKEIK